MKIRRFTSVLWIALYSVSETGAQPPDNEIQVRRTVESFYAAFNSHQFDNASAFTTEDWNHINPNGGWTRGRDAVLRELKGVHSTFLKGVSDTVEDMTVRFASPDVAIAVVTSHMGTYYSPDGSKHENERNRRTFIVVRRDDRWRITQDQNTVIRARGGRGRARLRPGEAGVLNGAG